MHESLEGERKLLRQELSDLKGCQIRYVSLAMTVTGVLVGIALKLSPTGGDPSPVFIAPLAVILPCWLVFFDKATTISRIVGYLRHLEIQLYSASTHETKWIGWERALRRYRDLPRTRRSWSVPFSWLKSLASALLFSLTFVNTHRYWAINWYTFFGLSALCLRLASKNAGEELFDVSLGLTCIVGVVTLVLLGSLTSGDDSYNAMEDRWAKVDLE